MMPMAQIPPGHELIANKFLVTHHALKTYPAEQLAADMGVSLEEVQAVMARVVRMPTVPEGLDVWYEYGHTPFSPGGRELADPDDDEQTGWRRFIAAHICERKIIADDAGTGNEAETRLEVALGVAVCNPGDNFEKHIGRRKALKRALKNGGLLPEKKRKVEAEAREG